MTDFLARFNAGELTTFAAVAGGLLIAITAIIAGTWRKTRRTEILAALKQDMLNRGMSADEIRAVLEAGSGGCRKSSSRVE